MSELFKTEIKAQKLSKSEERIDFFSNLWNMSKEYVVSSMILIFSKMYKAFGNKESSTEFYERIYTGEKLEN